MSDAMPVRPPRHRGIYLLPNLVTTGAMFAGFYAIIASIGGRYTEAAVAVFIAAVLDGLDGRVARLTGTQTEFGVQYDSLSDLISFGLAPALVMYTWSLAALKDFGPLWGKLGWAAAFIYAACAALRLARFNTQAGWPTNAISRGWLARPLPPCACRSCGAWTNLAWTAASFASSRRYSR
jgi:CDP-diacylglycerol---serine O-phosphatidyltransferase